MDRLHQELWARKVCIDRQDADLRNSRLRVKELEVSILALLTLGGHLVFAHEQHSRVITQMYT